MDAALGAGADDMTTAGEVYEITGATNGKPALPAGTLTSNKVGLSAGQTVFHVKAFDAASGAMQVEEASNTPDSGFGMQALLYLLPVIFIILVLLAILIAATFFISKKLSAKK